MIGLALAGLAARQADWLAARQRLISENVAQADTPGYQARDVKPFADLVASGAPRFAVTSRGHMTPDPTSSAAIRTGVGQSWDVKHSGNSVSLEQQMSNAGEVRTAYGLNVGIVRAFNRMLLASLKG